MASMGQRRKRRRLTARSVSRIIDVMEKCAKLKGASNPAFNLELHVGVFVIPIISTKLVSSALRESVSIRATTLERITNAPVEIIVLVSVAPEGNSSNLLRVIDQL